MKFRVIWLVSLIFLTCGCGSEFEVFKASSNNANSLIDNSVTTLVWSKNPENENVVAYILKIGTSAGVYDKFYHVSHPANGSEVQFDITDLSQNRTYFATVTAMDNNGQESDPSDEIMFGN